MGTVTSQVALSHPTDLTLQELGQGQSGRPVGQDFFLFLLLKLLPESHPGKAAGCLTVSTEAPGCLLK